MGTLGAYEGKSHFSELLRRVEKGEQITITRHGVAIARLVPVKPSAAHPVEEVVKALLHFRKGRKLNQTALRSMIKEGRRF